MSGDSLIFDGLVALGVIGALGWCISDDISNWFSPPSHLREIETTKDVHANSDTILRDYEINEHSADSIYKDKVVEITGKVSGIGSDIFNSIYLIMGDGFKQVQAYFDETERTLLRGVKVGEKITVRCLGDGEHMFNVVFDNCVIVIYSSGR